MSPPRESHVTIDEISPRLHLATHAETSRERDYTYRVLSHHLILLESGWLETRMGRKTIRAQAGDMVCFRASPRNWYRAPARMRNFQVQLEFAPPPRQTLTPWLDGIGALPFI